jgi:hypothetical protein
VDICLYNKLKILQRAAYTNLQHPNTPFCAITLEQGSSVVLAAVSVSHVLGWVAGNFRAASNGEKLRARILETRLSAEFSTQRETGFAIGLAVTLWQLMCVSHLLSVRKGKLFLVFRDFQQAFPLTTRAQEVANLLENGIIGDMLTVRLHRTGK